MSGGTALADWEQLSVQHFGQSQREYGDGVRQAIRPAQVKAAEKQLADTMHEKPSLIMLLSAKQEASLSATLHPF